MTLIVFDLFDTGAHMKQGMLALLEHMISHILQNCFILWAVHWLSSIVCFYMIYEIDYLFG